jgi:hypothetical protein
MRPELNCFVRWSQLAPLPVSPRTGDYKEVCNIDKRVKKKDTKKNISVFFSAFSEMDKCSGSG